MLIVIDEKDPRPLYQQIAAQLKDQVLRGEMQPGDELPAVRELADDLGINLHTVRNAYLRLREQGVIDFRLGRRARISRPRETGPTAAEAERVLGARVRELVADAYLLGLSRDELRGMLDRYAGDDSCGTAHHDSITEDRR